LGIEESALGKIRLDLTPRPRFPCRKSTKTGASGLEDFIILNRESQAIVNYSEGFYKQNHFLFLLFSKMKMDKKQAEPMAAPVCL